MAKKKTARQSGGPYLAAAVFCDQIVRGDDGATSVIRIVDQISVILPSDAPANVLTQVAALLVFKTGYDGGGVRTLRLVVRSPSGAKTQEFTQEIEFTDAPHGGSTVRLNIGIPVKDSGVYWTYAHLDGKLMARMPLNVIVKREEELEPAKTSKKRKTEKKKIANRKK